MNSSLKIGIVAGVIAGLLGGILSIFYALSMFDLGLTYLFFEDIPLNKIAITEIALKIFLGILLGIIYSKFHNLIPGKGISKAFMFGLIYILIYSVRWTIFDIMYGYPYLETIYSMIVSFPMVFILGIFFELLSPKYSLEKEKFETIKYDLKGGFYPGAIAGIVAGISSFFYTSLIINPILWPKYFEDIGFLLSQLGSHIMFNMVWGIVFGILFSMFYEKIPGKGILKGLIFGMILYLINNFQLALYFYAYGNYATGLWLLLAAFVYIPFGLVIGYLYRKPSD